MPPIKTNRPVNGYVELASPQFLDSKWQELRFDLLTGLNVLQDVVVPETAGGYVYRDAHQVRSAAHNRFLYWRIFNDILEFIELSSEVVLEGNQVRIRFAGSPVINSINVIEFSESVVIMVATLTSVHRLCLPHPKSTEKSIFFELSNEVLYNPANYHVFSNHASSDTQQPIFATSWYDKNMLKSALTFPDSSILIVQFGRTTHHVSTYEIRQVGIIGRIWSRMPNLLARNPHDCDNAIFACSAYNHLETNDVLLFAFCRDCKIRVFSTNNRECLLTYNMIPQSSFSQSFASHTNPTTEQPMMKMFGSQIIVYLTEGKPEFVMLDYSFEDNTHMITERFTVPAHSWERLIDFSLTENKIWALATIRELETALCYLDMKDSDTSELIGIWDFVNLDSDLDLPTVKNYNAEIFWRNRFSLNTVQKALACIAGANIPKKNDKKSLEEVAFTRIVDDDQEEAWTKFYNYCLQNHLASNKNIGLVVSSNESVISIVKRANPSFVCPWPMSVDMILQGGPYRGIEFSTSLRSLIGALNYISAELISEEDSFELERRLSDNPSKIRTHLEKFVESAIKSDKVDFSKLNYNHKHLVATGIDYICEQLDLTAQAKDYGKKVLETINASIKCNKSPLGSNSGITTTYELFRRLVKARMILARDLLVYIILAESFSRLDSSSTAKFLSSLCEDIFTSAKMRLITDCYRSYGILVWIAESPIKVQPSQKNIGVVERISNKFKFFKKSINLEEITSDSTLEANLRQNLFTNFLLDGGTYFAGVVDQQADQLQTLSSSFYVTEVSLNICKILWPKSEYICFAEFLFTHQLDEHLDEYLDMMEEWLEECLYDRHFIRAANSLLRDSPVRSVDIFNRLWMHMTYTNLIGRFVDLDKERTEAQEGEQIVITPSLIYRYYDKLISLFQSYNNPQSLISLINRCMSLLDENADEEQSRWVNRFRAELFQYHLQLEETDEAYHTMVLTTDPSLRTNCLRKFIVYHCEKELWSNLLSYPFIDIKMDFIDIITIKAESSDLSTLNSEDFYKTSYYDLLFASYVSDDEFKRAAEVMYNYAQRLAQEVPSIISIRKQTDCLLIALNALRCVDETDAYIEFGSSRHDGRSSVLKRAHDSELSTSIKSEISSHDTPSSLSLTNRIDRKEIEMKYELTKARLRLLEKDQTANAIALSPLKPVEIITQLVSSSMFSAAIDLSILFKTHMEPILEGLTAKYIFVMGLSSIDFAIHQDLERSITEIFTSSYSNISTYNYIANSTSPFVEKLWRFIDYYLSTYDGVSHMYSNDDFKKTFSGSTVLMRTVAIKLLSAGHDIPASLRRMYLSRNVSELLKLLVKYDKLIDAYELAVEMVDKVLEPANCFAFATPFSTKDPAPLYLPTHLILLLISFLKEDVTDTQLVKAGDILIDKLNRYRCLIKSM